MNIKQYQTFKFENQKKGYRYLSNSHDQNKIIYVQFFLNDCYGYVYRAGGIIPFFASLQAPNGEWGMGFNELDLNIDMENNRVYLGEIFDPYEHNMTEQEFKIKTNYMTDLQLCQNNIIDCAVMTKENFIHLLLAWDKILNQLPPFALLYLDDQDWYEVMPFDSQEAMEQFVADQKKQ